MPDSVPVPPSEPLESRTSDDSLASQAVAGEAAKVLASNFTVGDFYGFRLIRQKGCFVAVNAYSSTISF